MRGLCFREPYQYVAGNVAAVTEERVRDIETVGQATSGRPGGLKQSMVKPWSADGPLKSVRALHPILLLFGGHM